MTSKLPLQLDKNLLKKLFTIKNMRDIVLKKSKHLKLNLKSIFANSDKKYPKNVFKTDHKKGYCEACNAMKPLNKVSIIKKPSLNFLKYHPINIVFLCRDCHDISKLSRSKLNRIKAIVNKRIRRIKKAMKLDEKYLQNYEL